MIYNCSLFYSYYKKYRIVKSHVTEKHYVHTTVLTAHPLTTENVILIQLIRIKHRHGNIRSVWSYNTVQINKIKYWAFLSQKVDSLKYFHRMKACIEEIIISNYEKHFYSVFFITVYWYARNKIVCIFWIDTKCLSCLT